MTQVKRWIGLAALGLVFFAIAGYAIGRVAESVPYRTGGLSQGPGIAPGLMVARSVNGDADVIVWDGAQWGTAVPASALPSVTDGIVTNDERIFDVLPAPGLINVALSVEYCIPGSECEGRYFVYNRDTESLTDLYQLQPVSWFPDGLQLLVSDRTTDQGAIYNLASGVATPLSAPDEIYSLGYVDSLAPDGSRLLYSDFATGEKILDLTSSSAVALAGTPSYYNTHWLAWSPDGQRIAAVRIRDGEASMLSAGSLSLFDGSGGQEQVASDSDAFDFNPVWSDGGSKVVFLRANAAAWRSDALSNTPVFGSNDELLPAGLVVLDIATGTTTSIAGNDAVRRSAIVPAAGDTVVYLKAGGGAANTDVYTISTSGGSETALLSDGIRKTALGWAPAN